MVAKATPASYWTALVGGVRVVFGHGCLQELGALTRDLGGSRVLLVTDPGLRRAGHSARTEDLLQTAGLETVIFDQVAENPTTGNVADGAALASERGVDFIVAVGGGSALDCAKGINFLVTNGGRMEDYWGFNIATQPMLPSIGIPTTAGTGSEAQSYALISQERTHRKMACGDEKARFRVALLDPSLLSTVPRQVAAAAGMDAIAHAVESYVSTRANPVSRTLAREAWRLLEDNLELAVKSPRLAAVWGPMLLGSHLAGAAIEQSMLGAAHACANPLTARFGLAHGVAVALMLPHVVRLNASAVDDLYRELLGIADRAAEDPAEGLALRLEELRSASALPERLSECGVTSGGLEELALEAAQQWTARFNPHPVDAAQLLGLYRAAL